MKISGLNNYYLKIIKKLKTVNGYLDNDNIEIIFKACRLKPIIDSRILYRKWYDEYCNSIFISDKKTLKITLNDLSLDRNKIICSDYYNLDIYETYKISKLAYIYVGEIMFVSFLGIDNFLRSFVYNDGWKKTSPLLGGFAYLCEMFESLNLKGFRKAKKKVCKYGESWLCSLPTVHKSFLNGLKIKNKALDFNAEGY